FERTLPPNVDSRQGCRGSALLVLTSRIPLLQRSHPQHQPSGHELYHLALFLLESSGEVCRGNHELHPHWRAPSDRKPRLLTCCRERRQTHPRRCRVSCSKSPL